MFLYVSKLTLLFLQSFFWPFIETRIIGKFLMIRPFLFFFGREDKFCIVPIKPLHLSLLRFLTIILRKFNDLERFMPHILFTLFWSSVLVHPTSTGLGWPHSGTHPIKCRFSPKNGSPKNFILYSDFSQKSPAYIFQIILIILKNMRKE